MYQLFGVDLLNFIFATERHPSASEQNRISVRNLNDLFFSPADGGLRMHRNVHKSLPGLVVKL